MDVDPALGAAEPDPEIQDLITGSAGDQRGARLPARLAAVHAGGGLPAERRSSRRTVVWLDALISNVDRTPRNPNLLVWHERLWLIDHGAALYFHHRDWDPAVDAVKPFAGIADHVLLPIAGLDRRGRRRLGRAGCSSARRSTRCPPTGSRRSGYFDYLTRRLAAPARMAAVSPFQYAIVRVVPAGRAGRVHERRRRVLLPPAALPGGADRARRGAAGGVRARASTWRRCARTSTR